MKCSYEYLVDRYGVEQAQAALRLNKLQNDSLASGKSDLAVLAKRIRSWLGPTDKPVRLTDNCIAEPESFVKAVWNQFMDKFPGRTIMDFRLARKDDSRPYDFDNVRFIERNHD